MQRILVGIIALTCAILVCAQDITFEEVQQLEKLRAEASAKGIALSPEQEVHILQQIRAIRALANKVSGQSSPAMPQPLTVQPQPNQPQATQSPATAAAPAVPVLSEAELKKSLDDLPSVPRLRSTELLRDGLNVNGQRYVDPAGRAERFALDAETGTAGYVVHAGAQDLVKIVRIGSGREAITIGRMRKEGSQQVFESQTGKMLSGQQVLPLPDGVLVLRDSVAFRYTAGVGIQQINLPNGWSPVPLQRGNVSATGWLLLERETSDDKSNAVTSTLGLLKKLGELGGMKTPADYALYRMADAHMLPLEISVDGKTVTSYSQCRRQNAVVNKCDRMTSMESVWATDGSTNIGHYFWRIDWQKLQGRNFAVVHEHGLSQVNGYDLDTGKKVNLFDRSLGINGWQPSFTPEGSYRVQARLAFDTASIDDLPATVDMRPEAESTKTKP